MELNKEVMTEKENTCVVEVKEQSAKENDSSSCCDLKCLKQFIGLGYVIIILKNMIKGFSEIIVKKMTGINPITLLLFRY